MSLPLSASTRVQSGRAREIIEALEVVGKHGTVVHLKGAAIGEAIFIACERAARHRCVAAVGDQADVASLQGEVGNSDRAAIDNQCPLRTVICVLKGEARARRAGASDAYIACDEGRLP